MRRVCFGPYSAAPPPMFFGRNTMPTQHPIPGAKQLAGHYSKWYLPAAQLDVSEYTRQQANYAERMGGEHAVIARELREKQSDLIRELAPLHSSRMYKSYLNGTGQRMPHYMRKIPAHEVKTGALNAELQGPHHPEGGGHFSPDGAAGEGAGDGAGDGAADGATNHSLLSPLTVRRQSQGKLSEDDADMLLLGGGFNANV